MPLGELSCWPAEPSDNQHSCELQGTAAGGCVRAAEVLGIPYNAVLMRQVKPHAKQMHSTLGYDRSVTATPCRIAV